ncbi:tyrosine-protein phosphatase [Lewinella sp. IMCC34183]|uniref:tyrosine-protein phosphatase n=1 Tax=Lewinella sp. IMCC34183 TaxID=2248762 RepID=UPI0013006151|nr:CpsB/CapC family capsule biosynthesis tyrosine phosphatase [Lewinella sp. IMCC34183]
MFDWLRRQPVGPEDYTFLGTDMHAHWLPGIDDGAKTVAESLQMLRRYEELGFTRLVATPHIMQEFYPNTSVEINGALEQVRQAARAEGISLKLDAAAEYMIDEFFEDHRDQYGLLALPGTKKVLIEFGFYSPPINLGQVIFRLQSQGYQPIIAHPERYAYYHKDPTSLYEMHARGLKLQVNLLSLAGHYGKSVKQMGQDLITGGYVTYLGSDAHSLHHLDKMADLLKDRKVGRLLSGTDFDNVHLFDE